MKHPYRIIGLLLSVAVACAFTAKIVARDGVRLATENATLRRVVDDQQFTLDTFRIGAVQFEMASERHADSLLGVIGVLRTRPVTVRHDTAFVPESTWVYVTDTLIPECSRCAKRVDSLVSQARVERRLSDSTITALNVWGAAGWRVAKQEARKATFARYAVPVAFLAGVLVAR